MPAAHSLDCRRGVRIGGPRVSLRVDVVPRFDLDFVVTLAPIAHGEGCRVGLHVRRQHTNGRGRKRCRRWGTSRLGRSRLYPLVNGLTIRYSVSYRPAFSRLVFAAPMPIYIPSAQRIVPQVPVQIQCLRIPEIGVRHRFSSRRPVRNRPPSLRRAQIPRPKVVVPTLHIPFFAGTTGPDASLS